MHYFIYSTKDATISSGSNHIDGASFTDQNFGQDEILDLKKDFWNKEFDFPTRILISFAGTEFTNVSQSIVNGNIVNPKFYLRLYETNGTQDLSTEYKLSAFPLSQSWDEGAGRLNDNPKVTNGVSWENRNYYPGSSAVSWSHDDGTLRHGGYYISGSGYEASQSFSYESPDIEMNVTDIVNKWLAGTSNYGFILRFSGSQETDNQTYGQLKFLSTQTNTIYSPKLEIRWDDHKPCTGSNTGSLLPMTASGEEDYMLYMKYLKESYKENDKVKFRVMPRKRYIKKTFSTSVQTVTGSFITEGSGSYSFVDMATGETIIPFSAYTSMSCDSTSNYFIQWMNGFNPNRAYKILYKLKYNDGQEIVYDDDFEFVVRS
tara:strand:- start:4699 stop:5820 length:1122 start_codon:yes stop_codon:yes gene_type:complete